MLDRDRVLAQLEELHGYVRELEANTPPSLQAYQADLRTRLVCERLLHVAIECTLDVADLFVRGLRLGLPESEAGVVERLRAAGVLPEDEIHLLHDMTRFRNVLVHRYGSLDSAKVFQNARRAPADFARLDRAFRDALEGWSGK